VENKGSRGVARPPKRSGGGQAANPSGENSGASVRLSTGDTFRSPEMSCEPWTRLMLDGLDGGALGSDGPGQPPTEDERDKSPHETGGTG